MEHRALAAVIELVETSGAFFLEEVLDHRVTDECLPIFNVNGTFRKIQKSKLLKCMDYSEVEAPVRYTAIVDMGFIWRLATPTKEDHEKQIQ